MGWAAPKPTHSVPRVAWAGSCDLLGCQKQSAILLPPPPLCCASLGPRGQWEVSQQRPVPPASPAQCPASAQPREAQAPGTVTPGGRRQHDFFPGSGSSIHSRGCMLGLENNDNDSHKDNDNGLDERPRVLGFESERLKGAPEHAQLQSVCWTPDQASRPSVLRPRPGHSTGIRQRSWGPPGGGKGLKRLRRSITFQKPPG